MAKEKKKGQSGAATNYISRARAVRKLQISLADFRRLCILKGIFPREPKNKKKVSGGSTANKTYYYVKDIQFLAHEPLLQKFREFKVFIRKLKRAVHKNEPGLARSLEESKPIYNLDRLVKERYPTFIDAVRDLDDALCMVFLFAQMPRQGGRITSDLVGKCWRLSREFESFVVRTRALRKTFLSIKGIYYQAEIMGQTITWIVPYQFSQGEIPTDVDFRVMLTFLEFYATLLGFVNYRLFSSLSLKYPPRIDAAMDANAGGLQALVTESAAEGQNADGTTSATATPAESKEDQARRKESNKRVASLGFAMSKILAKDAKQGDANTAESEDVEMKDADKEASAGDEFVALPGGDEAPTLSGSSEQFDGTQRMFEGLRVFVSREVPRHALEFVLRSRGAQVSWDETVGAGSSFKENDTSVTHQIVDRPTQGHVFLDRTYVQPQWVFDCLNAGKRILAGDYAPGRTLPPHLSPFVEATEGEYVPQGAPTGDDNGESVAADMDADSEDEEEKGDESAGSADEDAGASDDEAAVFQKELEAELKGKSFSQQQQQAKKPKKGGKVEAAAPAAAPAQKKRKKDEASAAEEEKELAKIMMPKRQKRLYDQIMFSKKKKTEEAVKLEGRRREIEKAPKAKPPTKSPSKPQPKPESKPQPKAKAAPKRK
eukprot:Opistho-2@52866